MMSDKKGSSEVKDEALPVEADAAAEVATATTPSGGHAEAEPEEGPGGLPELGAVPDGEAEQEAGREGAQEKGEATTADDRQENGRPPGRAALYMALLSLFLAVAIGGGGLYAWQEISRAIEAAGERAVARDDRIGAVADRLDRTVETVDGVATTVQRLAGDVAGLQQGLQGVTGRTNDLAAVVARIQNTVQGGERALRVAEALYLQRIATERLRLAGDVTGALAALEYADGVLAGLADPRLLPVRELLAEEMAALRAVETPDTAGAALRIERMIAGLDALPVESAGGGPPEPGYAIAGDLPWWERGLERLFHELDRHVHIRRQGPADGPDDGSALLLRRLLALRLEAARVALLRRDEEGYRRALESAGQLLTEPLAAGAAEVLAVGIEDLARLRLRPELPDISRSYGLLTELAQRSPLQE